MTLARTASCRVSATMVTSISPLIEPAFRRAGWSAGRSVSVPLTEFCDMPIFPAATRLISEFNGLHVFPDRKEGEECATCDVRLDPLEAMHEAATAREWMPRLRCRIFPIGMASSDYMSLFVDEVGRIFETDLPCGYFCFVGESFSAAMEALLLGRHLRPLLVPGADGADGYYFDRWFPAGDPNIYDPGDVRAGIPGR